jgi:DNA-binding transcriptional regulator PaaX
MTPKKKKRTLPSVEPVEVIAAMPPERIRANLDAVLERLGTLAEKRERYARKLQTTTEEETRLTLQSQMLSTALTLHRQARTGIVPGAAERLRATIAAAPRVAEQTLAANVVTIVRQAQGAPVTPQQVHARLEQLGIDRSERVIRQALRRWRDEGVLVRDGHAYRALPQG